MSDSPYRAPLEAGLKQLGLTVDETTIEKLLGYHQLLVKWNRAYNLTAVRNPSEMIGRHLVDSASIARLIEGQCILDVGSGGGLPGMVMAILFPEREWHLLDSNGKKTRFLFQAKTELGLSNVTVHHTRVEAMEFEGGFDAIMSRAFATLADMVEGSSHLLASGGRFYAMKGVYPSEELSALAKHYKVESCSELAVPGESGERHLVVMSIDHG